MAKKNPSSDVPLQDVPVQETTADLGGLNPSSDGATTDLGDLNQPVKDTVDLGKLPPLAKFKKFEKKGK